MPHVDDDTTIADFVLAYRLRPQAATTWLMHDRMRPVRRFLPGIALAA